MVTIGHASKTENGGIKNGKAGDQTGKEVCIRSWYARPWNVVIRFKDKEMREKVAQCMEWACANDRIGYDQNQRNTLLNAVRNLGYDPRQARKNVETDCSALVTLCCIYAGIPERYLVVGGNSATTSTLKSRLKATGEVEIFLTTDYTNSPKKLLRGDILLSEGHHTAIVVKDNNTTLKSIDEIALEVKAGKWGNNPQRREALIAAGYDYEAVRQKVNELYGK